MMLQRITEYGEDTVGTYSSLGKEESMVREGSPEK